MTKILDLAEEYNYRCLSNKTKKNNLLKDNTSEKYDLKEYSNQLENINSNRIKKREIVGDYMEGNQYFEKYLERLEQDRRDLEKRLNNTIIQSEKRIHVERVEFEKRILKDRKESEIRLNKSIDQILSSLEQHNRKIDGTIEKLENKIDRNTESMNNKIDANNKWIMGVCLTTILSIAAMVISILLK